MEHTITECTSAERINPERVYPETKKLKLYFSGPYNYGLSDCIHGTFIAGMYKSRKVVKDI